MIESSYLKIWSLYWHGVLVHSLPVSRISKIESYHNIVIDKYNPLAPGTFELNFKYVTFKQILGIDDWGLSCELALIWMSLDFTADQSTLVHVMAWCRQAASHYVGQCWPRSLSPYGVTRPQWVNAALSQIKYLLTIRIVHTVISTFKFCVSA